MKVDEFEDVLKVGEHIGVEFKSARGGAKDEVFETVCSYSADKGDPIKSHETINDPIKSHKGINDPIKPREGMNETVNSIVLELIRKTPGIGSTALVPAVGKSRATVMRAVALLKQRHLIEHRGSDKTGGYYAI